MMWLVWRRQRVPLLAALGLVALVGVTAVVGRLTALAGARDLGVVPCLRQVVTGVCGTQVWYPFLDGYLRYNFMLTTALVALPAVAGAVAGAGLFGRELERGTHVFALSQSVSRLRWFTGGLVVAGVPVAAAVALVTPVAAWSVRPFGNLLPGPLSASMFLVTGVLPVVYTVLAFTVAAAAGLLLRSTVGALGVALAVQLVVVVVTSFGDRYDHYLPPETARVALRPAGQGDVNWPQVHGAVIVDSGYLDRQGREVTQQDAVLPDCAGAGTFSDCLRSVGLTGLYTRYQPASRYWPFQAIESALLLTLAAGALGAGHRGLRRRVH